MLLQQRLHRTHFSSHQQGGLAALPTALWQELRAHRELAATCLGHSASQRTPRATRCPLSCARPCCLSATKWRRRHCSFIPSVALPTPTLWHWAERSHSHPVFIRHFYDVSSSWEHQKEGGAASEGGHLNVQRGESGKKALREGESEQGNWLLRRNH